MVNPVARSVSAATLFNSLHSLKAYNIIASFQNNPYVLTDKATHTIRTLNGDGFIPDWDTLSDTCSCRLEQTVVIPCAWIGTYIQAKERGLTVF